MVTWTKACTKTLSCELPVFKKFEPLSNLFQLLHNAAIDLEGNQETDDRGMRYRVCGTTPSERRTHSIHLLALTVMEVLG